MPASAAANQSTMPDDDERAAVHTCAQRHAGPHDPRLQDAGAAVEHRVAEHEIGDAGIDALRFGQLLGMLGDELVVEECRGRVTAERPCDPVEERRHRGEVGRPEIFVLHDSRAEPRATRVPEWLFEDELGVAHLTEHDSCRLGSVRFRERTGV